MAIDNDKPAIILALPATVNGRLPVQLRPMLYGIEEEQIPLQTTVFDEDTAIKRAYKAAVASRLSVGISFDKHQIVVQYKNLKPDEPLFAVPIDTSANIRKIGANAARLVKGVPFKK